MRLIKKNGIMLKDRILELIMFLRFRRMLKCWVTWVFDTRDILKRRWC